MSNNYRHVSSNDGQDWPVNVSCCKIPKYIKSIKEIYGFTLRIEEALRPGATAFRDSGNTKIAALWEVLFQQFLFLAESIKCSLERLVKELNGDIGIVDAVQFFIEPVIDAKKFSEDMEANYCKTSCTAYTFWIFIKEFGPNIKVIEVQKTFDEIIKYAIDYSKKISGGNPEVIKKILDKRFQYEDEDAVEEEGSDNKKKKFTDRKSELKDLQKHERWKLLGYKDVMAYVYDMVMHNHEIQTLRLNALIHNRSKTSNSPTDVNTLWSPFTTVCARPLGCVINQGIFMLDQMFIYDHRSGTYTVKFPMRKYVLKVPLSMVSVQNILNRKLPAYQLNSTYSISKVIPVLMDDFEAALQDSLEFKTMSRNAKKKEMVASSWNDQYSRYKAVMDYIQAGKEPENSGHSTNEDEGIYGSSGTDDEDLDHFRMTATNMAARGQLKSQDSGTDIDQVLKRMNQEQMERRKSAVLSSNKRAQGMVKLIEQAKKFGLGKLIEDTLHANQGRFTKLIESQVVNCTTLFADGTDTRDNKQDDFYEFISIYAILSAQYICGRKAIQKLAQRLSEGSTSAKEIKNHKEVLRKSLLLLKKHMLKEYMTKCMSPDAYGISPFEAAVLLFHQNSQPFNFKIVHTKFDKSLGLFENMECKNYAKYNTIMQFADLHRAVSLLFKYSVDPWRYVKGMHLNIVLYSPDGGAGKSEAMDKVMDSSIPGTFQTESYRSARSDASSEKNLNGVVTVLPEIPYSFIDDSDLKNETAQRTKNLITSGMATSARLTQDPVTGKFKREICTSEQQGSFFGNSNRNIGNLSGPVKSRFHLYPVYKNGTPFREIIQAMGAEHILKDDLINSKDDFVKENQFMQSMIFHVEKGIQVGFLDDVQTDIGWIFMIVLQRALKSKGISVPNVRVSHSIIILARQNCIRECIERNWLHRNAKYNGKPVNMDQFLDIDPMLFLTTSHIVGAIGECYDRIVNPMVDVVRKCIRQLFLEAEIGSRFKRTMKIQTKGVGNNKFEKRITRFNYNYMRFPLYTAGGINDFCKRIEVMSATLGGLIVPPETAFDIVMGWVQCKVKSPFYAVKGKSNGPYEQDENTANEIETDLANIIPDKSIKDGDYVMVELAGKSIHFLYHHFIKEDPEESISILKNAVVDILSCSQQIDGKFLFSNDSQFPFVREVIEIRQHSTKMISLPAMNLIKRELKVVLEETHSISMSGESEEESWSKYAEGLYKYKGDNAGVEECDVTALGWDLNSYSMKQRYKRLYLTQAPINGPYASFNLFSGLIKAKKDIKSMDSTKREALPLQDDLDYKENGSGYFMGEELENIMKGENIFDLEEMFRNLCKFYSILDTVDEEQGDEDFNREDYVVKDWVDMDQNICKKYHWEMLESPLNDPLVYKLVRHHPKIVNDFFNLKNEDLNIETDIYPKEVIDAYKEAKSKQWEVAEHADWSKKDKVKKYVEENKLYIDGYTRLYDADGDLKELVMDEDDPFQAVGQVYYKPKVAPKPVETAKNSIRNNIGQTRKREVFHEQDIAEIINEVARGKKKRKKVNFEI